MRSIGQRVFKVTSILLLAASIWGGPVIAGGPADITYADIVTLGPNPQVMGTSKLVRNDNGVSVNIDTEGLVPGDAYTIWLIMFNNDFSFVAALNISGGSAGGNGQGRFAGHQSVGVLPPVDGSTVVLSVGGVFDDPRGVNVQLIVRNHGPVIPGLQQEQFGTIMGGCPPNTCGDVQVSFHPGL